MDYPKKWHKLIDKFIDQESRTAERPWDDKTIAWYRDRLAWFTRYAVTHQLKPKKVKARHLNYFFADLKQQHDLKWTTRKGTFTATRCFFAWLYRRGKIETNPFLDPFEPVKSPTKSRSVVPLFPVAYARQMIEAAEAEGSVAGIRDAAIMRLLLTTGMRREEITGLRLDSINPDGDEFVIKGKFGHQRDGLVPATTMAALKLWLEKRPRTFDRALFVSLRPSKKGIHCELVPDAINDLLIKWRDRAGLPRVSVSPHKWRHRFATELARGQNPFALQDLLGHSNIATSAGYVHSSMEQRRSLLRGYGPDVPHPGADQGQPE